ncbi:DUF4926 domain-containing protein [Pseudoalteromonas sp. OOF1S-7]|uniref:DUF4926 domain-containing protein n=1 Tax=Pseudoalteromonas sp. OOF1S-7 TaxID=2917757 RepID=UPI001EF6007F|nr:DUF4926 domain-containing protein [Pseudoalteromonas sp. OOF1S-7]MCG7537293.1 DUF4926 domain-containing protein [Pseudoalteromonas sp. OOF1S-7]
MKQYSVVKIVSLNKAFVHTDQSFGSRTPQVGDIGTIVEVYDGAYDIECCDENGITLWLELFEPSDGKLELLYI